MTRVYANFEEILEIRRVEFKSKEKAEFLHKQNADWFKLLQKYSEKGNFVFGQENFLFKKHMNKVKWTFLFKLSFVLKNGTYLGFHRKVKDFKKCVYLKRIENAKKYYYLNARIYYYTAMFLFIYLTSSQNVHSIS